MADDWTSFPRADGKQENEWDAFPRVGKGKQRQRTTDKAAEPVRAPLTGEAVDGDTLRTTNGPNLRLYGADAPESDQQGWDRTGKPVPIGQRATQGLADLVTPEAVAGDYLGKSYGRPVAPVEQDGRDVGQTVIRSGNALAAPEYLKGNERFSPYMEAERLARQNRLGVHGVYAQSPEEYRHAPDKLPDRETIAQWFDTPTPFAGLRPEIERGYLAVQKTGTADQILKYATDNGFTIDPAITRKFVKARDAKHPVAFEVTYAPDAPKPLTNPGDGAGGAFARGIGDGVLPNFLDEAGALPDSFGLTTGRENVFNSDRRWADIYQNNLDQNRAILGYDEMAHPYARLGGEVAGGLAVPFGAGAKTVPELARVGAAYGAVAGFGGGETLPERLTGAVVNAGAGAVVTAAGGKLLEGGVKAGRRLFGSKAAPVLEGAGEAAEGYADAQVGDALPSGHVGAQASPAGRTGVINAETLRAASGGPSGVDMAQAGRVLRGEADAALARGDRVVLHTEGKAIPITRPGLMDDQGQSWGAMPILADTTGKNRLEITPGTARTPDRLDIGELPPRAPEPPRQPINTAYPGPAAGYMPPAPTGDWQADEAGMAERAMKSYRDMVRRGIESDPATGPEDYRPFSDYMAEWRDREAAARSGNRAAQDSIAAGLGHAPRERDWIDIAQVPPPPAGFRLDRPAAMAADAGEVATREVRQPDYLDIGQRPRPLLRDSTDAERRAATAGIDPGDVLPINSNEIGSVEEAAAKDAGRFAEAKAPDERGALTRRTVRGWNGSEVPKVGPIDLIGFLRLRGGLKDNAGELRSMDLDNRPRKMDFAGQEHRFGPLVNNESGTNLDDAAFAAWEAGYFPDLAERPDTATFLNALRDNYHGQRRNFLPEDFAEVDAHNALRAERHDLKHRSFVEGAPIYNDRSLPADEPAPFPPVEAYEDWPDGGPDFAGNIRLEKLDSPQDIKRALSTVNNRVGFDAATRGKVTQAETERLASELGMTPDTLLARRKGQALNAEEALAARQILAKSGNELVNLARKVKGQDHPGDDVLADFNRALQRHVAIQEQVSGATAEAGRALSQFRMIANSRNVRGDVLSAIVNQGGGRRKLSEAADLLLEAAETSPGNFNVIADKATKPGWLDKLVELRINMILSNPPTHIVNMVSNTMTALGQLPEHAVAAGVGAVRQAVAKGSAKENFVIDRVAGSEVGARAFGLLQGVNEGLAQFAKTLRTGEPSDFISKVEGHMEHAIGGTVGKVVRVPTALLSAEDEIFKAMARRMELAGLAARTAAKEGLKGKAASARRADLLANPTPEMIDRAFDHGRYLTFQRPLGGIASKVSMMTRDYPALKFIVPFVRTPTNLLKFAVERSPGAPILKEWRNDWKAGGARRDLAISRAMVGTGFGIAMASLAARGLITGSPPSDKNKERLLRADGWQPYSFKIGNKYYSYQRLDPFATTISVAADMATKQEGMSERQLDDQAMLLTASIMKTMGDKTWLSGTSDFLQAVNDSERYGKSYLRRLGASLIVPGGVGGVARAIDPVSRRADTVGEQVMASVPGQSSKLFPRRDVWGEPITNEGGVGPDYLSPMRQSTRRNDPATNEMLRLNATIGDLPKFHTVSGKRVEYSPAEYDSYSEAAGKGSHAAVSALVSSPGWKAMSPDGQRKAIKTAIDNARDAARAELGSGEEGQKPGEWDAFPKAGAKPKAHDEWDSFAPRVAQADVVGDLERLIPGVGMQSGFRTPEYQAEMKRRGYHPADNSAHLDGSSLDLTPPPGKSMGWLKWQVKRYRRDALLLNEGDHVHATFPGWYGAPVLGGAKAAGLVNPMAGR